MRRVVSILCFVVALAWSPALAMNSCGTFEEILGFLKTEHKEVHIIRGISRSGSALYDIFAGPNNTWTIIHTEPDCVIKPKCTCVVAFGTDAQFITEHLKAMDNGGI